LKFVLKEGVLEKKPGQGLTSLPLAKTVKQCAYVVMQCCSI